MEKTKLFAVTLNPEYFDYQPYDISEDDGNEVIIDGGRQFCNIDNKGYLKAIKQLVDEYDTYLYDSYYKGSIKAFLSDMLPKKENGKHLSPKEIAFLKKGLDAVTYANEEIICDCLFIITGKLYRHKGLRGYCQGDYVDAYYPVEDGITQYLDYVEAVYFGTGTEIMVHEEEDEPKTAEEVSGWTFYTANWKTEDIKAEVKEQCGYRRDDNNVEVILWLYDKTRTIKIDEYKLAD